MKLSHLLVVISLFFHTISYNLYATHSEHAPSTEWYVIDGTRNYGYAMAQHLLAQDISCTLLVPHARISDAYRLFGRSEKAVIIPCTLEQTNSVINSIQGARFIFFDPEYDSYRHWQKNILNTTDAVLAAAEHNGALFIYPGHIYPFGQQDLPLTEQAAFAPNSTQGIIMARIENKLKQAAGQHRCHTCILRTSYPFGPGVQDHLLSKTFTDISRNGTFTWLFDSTIPQQFCYTMDVATIAYLLAQRNPQPWLQCIHFAGTLWPTVDHFGKAIAATAGKPYKKNIVGRFKLALICLVEPNAKRGQDIAYAFQHSIFLDDTLLYTLLPDFTPTPPRDAFAKTIKWYQRYGKSDQGIIQ